MSIIFLYNSHSNILNIDKKTLLNCSAYHLRSQLNLNNQYSIKEKNLYQYHEKYFNTLNNLYLSQYPESSQADFILSVTSIMEFWSYTSQELGSSASDLKINTEFQRPCNSIFSEIKLFP